MSFKAFLPILSAMIGIAIFGWLKTKWDRWVPLKFGAKGRDELPQGTQGHPANRQGALDFRSLHRADLL